MAMLIYSYNYHAVTTKVFDMFEEFEKQEEDEQTLKSLRACRRSKSLSSVINKRRLDKFDLDDIMG